MELFAVTITKATNEILIQVQLMRQIFNADCLISFSRQPIKQHIKFKHKFAKLLNF